MIGKYEAAEEMNRRALEGYEKVLGKEHPDTLTSLSDMASVFAMHSLLRNLARRRNSISAAMLWTRTGLSVLGKHRRPSRVRYVVGLWA
jgi:hypothetical protein